MAGQKARTAVFALKVPAIRDFGGGGRLSDHKPSAFLVPNIHRSATKRRGRDTFRAFCPAMTIPVDQFRTVMQEMSERFSVRHTASAWSRSRPAKRARNSFLSPLATTGSVNESAFASRPRA